MAAVPPSDEGDPASQLADTHAALVRAEAELRRLHGQFAWLADLVQRDVAKQLQARDDLIAAQAGHIRLLNLTLAQERARRFRPKSDRDGGRRPAAR